MNLAPPTDAPPARVATHPTAARHWRFRHTAGLVVLTAFFVWLAMARLWPLDRSWLAAVAAMTVFILVAGHGIQGVWRGAFIDGRKKISLSQFQMLTWTVVIVSAFGVMAIARTATDPATALDITVPPTVWLLLGISTTSLVGSPLIKQSQQAAPEPAFAETLLSRQNLTRGEDVELDGKVVQNRDVRQASWADIFTGELAHNVSYLDVSKIQMFFFTVLLVLAYGTAIWGQLADGELATLPDVGQGMVTLLGISHAGYLAGKAAPASGPGK